MSKFLDQRGLQVLWELINNKFATTAELQEVICRGYYYNNEFFVNSSHTEKYVPYNYKLYIDLPTQTLYTCDGTNYFIIRGPLATLDSAGVMKLYNSLGYNEDGTISQKVLTDELNKKVEMSVNEETLKLFNYEFN